MSASHRNGSESIHQRTVRLLKQADKQIHAQAVTIGEMDAQIVKLEGEKSDALSRATEFLERPKDLDRWSGMLCPVDGPDAGLAEEKALVFARYALELEARIAKLTDEKSDALSRAEEWLQKNGELEARIEKADELAVMQRDTIRRHQREEAEFLERTNQILFREEKLKARIEKATKLHTFLAPTERHPMCCKACNASVPPCPTVRILRGEG